MSSHRTGKRQTNIFLWPKWIITDGDAEVMQPWCSSFIAYIKLFTSGNCINASKFMKVVFICEDCYDEQNM